RRSLDQPPDRAHGALRRTRSATTSRTASRRRNAAPLSRHSQAQDARLCASRFTRGGAQEDGVLVPRDSEEDPIMKEAKELAAGSGGSVVVRRCQVCESTDLDPMFFAGYLPPVNGMPEVGDQPREQPAYPAQVLSCRRCKLAQLGLI